MSELPLRATGPYRDGKVHVLSEMCETCIFRPKNLMSLRSGRVRGMIDSALENDSCITCHSTIYRDDVEPSICRGFFDRHKTLPIRLALTMGLIEYDETPTKETQ